MGVPELSKDGYRCCEHLGDTGCRIYASRPRSCRTFECQWLRGVLEVDGAVDTDLRPDSCGVIFDYRPESPAGEVFGAWEVWPGASQMDPARSVLRGLEEQFVVILTTRSADGDTGLS